jgi:outer membrane lipoprotein-sorting protein
MNKYSESLIELMAKAMEDEFKISSVQFGDVAEIINDGNTMHVYQDDLTEAVRSTDDYELNKAPLWWLHCSILVSLTDEQIETFKASFIQ